MKVKYTLLHNDKNTKARYGTLETNYGKLVKHLCLCQLVHVLLLKL